MRSMAARALSLSVLVALSAPPGLSSAEKPRPVPFPALPRTASQSPRPPLILIPGFMGTRLRDPETHRVAWGTMTNVLMGGDSDDLALSLDGTTDGVPGESLVPFQIYDSLWGVDYYREALRSLREDGGYQIGDIDHPRPGDDAFVFLYDWRRDNVDSARRLAEAIDRLKRLRGDPGERFDLVGHSLGGLIARYYIMYGGRDVVSAGGPFIPTMEGARHVNRVVLIGTPNQGCLEALRTLHRGIKKVFRPMRPEVVFTMPAVYQMLPPPGSVIFADRSGAPLDLDLYDADTWVRQGWSAFSPDAQRRIAHRLDADDAALERHDRLLRDFLAQRLANARLFREALDAPEPPGEPVEYHTYGSDCRSTRKAAIVARHRGEPELLFDEGQIRDTRTRDRVASVLYGPGDGVVTRQSLLGLTPEAATAFFVCGQHGVLPNKPLLQNSLLRLLLHAGDEQARASIP